MIDDNGDYFEYVEMLDKGRLHDLVLAICQGRKDDALLDLSVLLSVDSSAGELTEIIEQARRSVRARTVA